MESRDEFASWLEKLMALGNVARDDPATSLTEAAQIAAAVIASPQSETSKAALLFSASSVIINSATALEDTGAIGHGKQLAEQALYATAPHEPLHYQCRYNIANAINALCDMKLPNAVSGDSRVNWEPELIKSRIQTGADLKRVRQEYFEIGGSSVADNHTRSAAYCNLGNLLDHSGRWAEAYDFYLRALEADGRNGNAAGNLAMLLHTRIVSGIGQTGHIAAVHDKYVALAQELRGGTLDFASVAVADRWDRLTPTESEGHLTHGLDDLDAVDAEYRSWVADLRLALSPAVEGLGTDELRWDSASIEVLYGASAEDMNPPILGAMNVLKSDFLVSRRLAFDAIAQLSDGLAQQPEDSGYYVDTLDHSLYGVQYSQLVLAQRSALDVLDKTAVVANEHFAVGDVPKRVSFRGFWTTKSGELRDALLKGPGRSLPNLALAELASDMEASGMYAASQALRNAGTHRIVHAALLSSTGVTENSRSKVDLLDLVKSTILALQVTRSAYLYLIDLVAMWNQPDDHPGDYTPFPNIGYLHDPTADGLKSDGNTDLKPSS
ncbi:LA2681 family HEPN domain-containing protein [Nocardioides sp. NBC_00850]|uniref:LA2681 family HEPN domain-containing protein n=1 Tax=Nocardioides sp. NBC_00850 TaxID=2976001 RepID=UPI0038693048|nr:LA2681 family HEPN domain-containing protein [Nocardioides sp. NBC_00850]